MKLSICFHGLVGCASNLPARAKILLFCAGVSVSGSGNGNDSRSTLINVRRSAPMRELTIKQ